MSCELTCEEMFGKDWETILRELVTTDENGCLALRSTGAGGGGSYTFPSNSGNTAYVSSAGNNATGVVGNISKPFLTANAAIAALNNAVDGALIILSSTSTIEITDYDHTSMPENLAVQVLCDADLSIEGDADYGRLAIQTNGEVIINSQTTFSIADALKINCRKFTIASTSNGSITYGGVIDCDDLEIQANMNINIAADVLNWSKSASVGAVNTFTYNICPPKQWKARLTQTDTSAPVVDFVYKNTYGESMTTSRLGAGFYTINSAGNLFIVDKTQVYFGTSDLDIVTAPSVMNKGGGSDGEVAVYSLDQFLGVGDNLMKALDITIETYL